jgi:RNA polymerase sigma-70 factor, ECF subfamily
MGGTRAGGCSPEDQSPRPSEDLEKTADLLARVRGGDRRARDVLARRYLDILRRIAHGRLPQAARSLVDTWDLVQQTVMKALDHIDTFESRGEGAYLAYLRRILFNAITDEVRRVGRLPGQEELSEDLAHADPSPLESTIGRERLEAYERALEFLTPQQREAVICRFEYGMTYEEVRRAIDAPTANAARMLIGRAVVRLAQEMRAHRDE